MDPILYGFGTTLDRGRDDSRVGLTVVVSHRHVHPSRLDLCGLTEGDGPVVLHRVGGLEVRPIGFVGNLVVVKVCQPWVLVAQVLPKRCLNKALHLIERSATGERLPEHWGRPCLAWVALLPRCEDLLLDRGQVVSRDLNLLASAARDKCPHSGADDAGVGTTSGRLPQPKFCTSMAWSGPGRRRTPPLARRCCPRSWSPRPR